MLLNARMPVEKSRLAKWKTERTVKARKQDVWIAEKKLELQRMSVECEKRTKVGRWMRTNKQVEQKVGEVVRWRDASGNELLTASPLLQHAEISVNGR